MFPRHLHTWFRTALGSFGVRPNGLAATPVARFTAAALLAAMLGVPVTAPDSAFADSSAGPAPGLAVSPTAVTIKEGRAGRLSVALKSRPSGAVLVRVWRSTADHIAVNKVRMRFTPENWSEPQTVRLLARQDEDAADETTVFTFSASGGGYDGMTPVTAEVRVNDDDEIGLAVSPTAVTVKEGRVGQLSAALKSRPWGAVLVRVWRSTAEHIAVNKVRMRFTPENWSEPQTVRLHARQDEDAADQTMVFTFSASGGGYDGMTPVTAEVLVDDDEEIGVAVSPDAVTVKEGRVGQLSAALKSRPSGAVLVRVWRSTANHIAVNRVRMRFTPENWSEPQTVRLHARQDEDAADETTVFTFTASGGGYDGMTPATVEVLVDDDEAESGPARSSEELPTLSIDDASAAEGNADGKIYFDVRLSRPSERLVEVDFRTVEGGTATPGADYRVESYTLAFSPGTTSVRAGVFIVDDDIDDDGETVLVELSNARLVTWGAGRWPRLDIETSRAIGTIRNSDSLPKDWLARFGRTVAEQVLEAVETRTRAPRAAGAELTLAGQRVGGAAARHELVGARAEGNPAGRLRIENDIDRMHGLSGRTATGRELLTGSSFALTGGTQGTGFYTLWGSGAATHLDGREGGLSLDGEVASGMLGADWARGAVTAGLVVSRSRGEGSYRGESGGGATTSSLTGVYPWGGYALSERLSVWGVAGYGEGRLTLTPEGQAPIETDLDLAMAAAGLRGVLVEAPEAGGIELALKSDALGVRTSSAGGRGLEAEETEATRLRLGLEGSLPMTFEGGASLTPSVEIGARLDGGDAETGFGVEIAGGLAWSDPHSGLSAAFRGRGLLSHAAEGFRARSVSGSLSWDPTPASERGLELTMSQTAGAAPASGMDAIFEQGTLAGLATGDIGGDGEILAQRGLEIRLGYGLAAFGGGFVSKPELGLGLSNGQRDYSVGWRLMREGRYGGSFGLSLEARLRESANDNANPEHAIGARLLARF